MVLISSLLTDDLVLPVCQRAPCTLHTAQCPVPVDRTRALVEVVRSPAVTNAIAYTCPATATCTGAPGRRVHMPWPALPPVRYTAIPNISGRHGAGLAVSAICRPASCTQHGSWSTLVVIRNAPRFHHIHNGDTTGAVIRLTLFMSAWWLNWYTSRRGSRISARGGRQRINGLI